MPFEPATVIAKRCNTDHLKYRIRADKGTVRLYIAVRKELSSQVKGDIKAWRLDIDRPSGRGRLTGLIQDDGSQATRRGSDKNGKGTTTLMSWALTDNILLQFPDNGSFAALKNHDITSIGIEFDLPVAEANRGS